MSVFQITVPIGKTKRLLTQGKYCPSDILVTAEGLDLSMVTVTPSTLAEGIIAINAKGELIVGTAKFGGNASAKLGSAILGTMKLGG